MDDPRGPTGRSALRGDAIDYDPETNTYRAYFDGRVESASVVTGSTVAAVAGAETTDIDPIYSGVDPDALDALMAPRVLDSPRGDVHVSFTLSGHDVTVHSYGLVAVEPPDEGTP